MQEPFSCARTISIRAPTRGATISGASASQRYIFQSALPRGERLYSQDWQSITSYFNPRSHEGSDNFLSMLEQVLNISIRAPTRGATSMICIVSHMREISIRAPTRGATYHNRSNGHRKSISIRAPTRGATSKTSLEPLPGRISIRAPTRGATILPVLLTVALLFQSALPRGERRMYG